MEFLWEQSVQQPVLNIEMYAFNNSQSIESP